MSISAPPHPADAMHSPIGASIDQAAARRLQFFEHRASANHRDSSASTRSAVNLLLEDIDVLQALLFRFKRQLNQLRCPILRLPPEVLQLIVHAVDVAMGEHISKERAMSWIRLGRVSHRFRSVLLGMHALWAGIAFTPAFPTAHQQLLDRAQNAPVTMILPQDESAARINCALQHLQRARIIIGHGNVAPIVARELDGKALPFLHSLSLDMHIGSSEPDKLSADQTQPRFCYVSPFSAPHLRHVRLANVFLRSGFLLRNLTTLSLHCLAGVTTTSAPSPTAFLDTLRLCPNLEDLDLTGCIPDLSLLTAMEQRQIITLSSLKSIRLSQYRARTLQFWRMLELPASTTILLNWHANELEASSGPIIAHVEGCRAFTAHIIAYNSVMPPVSGISLIGSIGSPDASDWVCIRLLSPKSIHETSGPADIRGSQWTCVLEVSMWPETGTADDLAVAIDRFSTIFQLSQLKYIDVDCDTESQLIEANLPPIYASFKAIDTLTLDYCCTPDAIEPLGHILSSPSGSISPKFCPKLSSLILSSGSMPEAGIDFAALYVSLREMLSTRAKAGCPIALLVLEYEDVPLDVTDSLAMCVDELRVQSDAAEYRPA